MKIRFVTKDDGRVEIRARRKDTGHFDTLGYCHPASVPLIRKEGIRARSHLVILPNP